MYVFKYIKTVNQYKQGSKKQAHFRLMYFIRVMCMCVCMLHVCVNLCLFCFQNVKPQSLRYLTVYPKLLLIICLVCLAFISLTVLRFTLMLLFRLLSQNIGPSNQRYKCLLYRREKVLRLYLCYLKTSNAYCI